MKPRLLLLGLVIFILTAGLAFATVNDAEIYYTFDDVDLTGSDPDDISGNGNDGTNNGATTGISGQVNEAFDGDGINDYILTPSVAADSTATYAFWFNPADLSNEAFIAKRAVSGTREFVCLTDGSSQFDCFFYNGGNGAAGDILNINITPGGWNHFALTKNGVNVEIFINGVSQGTDSTAGKGTITDEITLLRGGSSEAIQESTASVDEFAYYTRVLTDPEISDLYDLGAAGLNPYVAIGNFTVEAQDKDTLASLTNINISYTHDDLIPNATGGPTRVTGRDGDGVLFDGVDDYVTIDDTDYNNNSISFWFKTGDSVAQTAYAQTDIYNTGTWFHFQSGGYKMRYTIGGTSREETVTQAYADNAWHHVVMTWNGTNWVVWHDNTVIMNDTTYSGAVTSSTAAGSIGRSASFGGLYFNGTLDDFRIYDRVITEEEVASLYTNYANPTANGSIQTAFRSFYETSVGNSSTQTPTTIPVNSSYLWDLRFDVDGYYSQVYSNINVSVSPFEANMSAFQYSNITANTYTVSGTNYQLTNYSVILNNGTGETVYSTSNGSVIEFLGATNLTFNVTIFNASMDGLQLNISETFTNWVFPDDLIWNYTVLNITAVNGLNASPVAPINYVRQISNNTFNQSSADSSVLFYFDKDYNQFDASIDVDGHALANISQINLSDGWTGYNWSLSVENSINFTFKDSSTGSTINFETVTMTLQQGNVSTNYTTTNGSIYLTLLAPGSYNLTANSPSYSQTSQSFILINRTTDQITVFMVNSSLTDTVIATLIDQSANTVADYDIKVMHFDPSTGSFILEDTETTNFQGQVALDIVLFTDTYFFIVQDSDGNTVHTTNAAKVVSTTMTIQIIIGEDLAQDIFAFENIYSTMYFDNTSHRFIWTYNDQLGTISQACLNVYYDNALYNQTCSASTAATIQAGVLNESGREYLAKGFVIFSNQNLLIDSEAKYYATDAKTTLGIAALGALVLLTMTFVLLGLRWGATGAILLAPIPMILFKAIGFLAMPWAIVISIEIVAFIIAGFLSRGRS